MLLSARLPLQPLLRHEVLPLVKHLLTEERLVERRFERNSLPVLKITGD
jgi:hypothetical protein